ncbi:hypothetical protein AMECASPLE_020140 [Ameca splendens]|uniref:Uncharacterized protein n=1 Tax=Ameca splendens TaxID=208324 RepID=A0ABV1A0X5_9TELE
MHEKGILHFGSFLTMTALQQSTHVATSCDHLIQHSSLPHHMSSSFLPDVLDPATDDVASRLGQNFGGRTQAALMLSADKHTTQLTTPARTRFRQSEGNRKAGSIYSLVWILLLHHICRNTCMP